MFFMMKRFGILLGCLTVLSQWSPAAGQIAWFGTWKGGLAEAERTGKPILLISAAPQCHNVPGVW